MYRHKERKAQYNLDFKYVLGRAATGFQISQDVNTIEYKCQRTRA